MLWLTAFLTIAPRTTRSTVLTTFEQVPPYPKVAFPVCEKAAEGGGSDTEADLECIKYFNALKAKCWPCICVIAKIDKVVVKGC